MTAWIVLRGVKVAPRPSEAIRPEPSTEADNAFLSTSTQEAHRHMRGARLRRHDVLPGRRIARVFSRTYWALGLFGFMVRACVDMMYCSGGA